MVSQKKNLLRARLYLVLDRQVAGYESLFEILRQAVPAGVDIVQLRDKYGSAKEIASFARQALRWLRGRVPFIINDRVDVARLTGADGVHLGQDDLPLIFARKMLGGRAIIGMSCQDLPHVRRAQDAGADYIGFGSVFKTLTKPDRAPLDLRLLDQVSKISRVPVFAIGGIGLKNVSTVLDHDIRRVAVTRAICEADNVAAATKTLRDILLS